MLFFSFFGHLHSFLFLIVHVECPCWWIYITSDQRACLVPLRQPIVRQYCLSVSSIYFCEDLSEVVRFFCCWWVVWVFGCWPLQVLLAYNTCSLLLDDLEPWSLLWAHTVWECFFFSPQNFSRQQVQPFESFSQPPFLNSLVLRSSPVWRNRPVSLNHFWVKERNSAFQTPIRNASVTSSAVKEVNVLNVFPRSLVKLLTWWSIPVEQVTRTHFIWPFTHKHYFTVSVDSNVSAYNVLADWSSDSCCIPSLSGFDDVSDDFHSLLWSEKYFSVNRANVVCDHLSVLEVCSALHTAAECLDWDTENSLGNCADKTWINTARQQEWHWSVSIQPSSHCVNHCCSDSVQMLFFSQLESFYVVNPFKVVVA